MSAYFRSRVTNQTNTNISVEVENSSARLNGAGTFKLPVSSAPTQEEHGSIRYNDVTNTLELMGPFGWRSFNTFETTDLVTRSELDHRLGDLSTVAWTGDFNDLSNKPARNVLENLNKTVTLTNNGILEFNNGAEVGNSQIVHQGQGDWFDGADLYAPAGFQWVQLNYDDSNYVWVTSSFAGIDVGQHTWRFEPTGKFRLPAGGDIVNSSGQSVLGAGGANALSELSDVTLNTPTSGQVLAFNGSAWENTTINTGGGGGSNIVAGTGINYNSATGLLSIGQNVATTADVTFKTVTADEFISTSTGVPTFRSATNIVLAAAGEVIIDSAISLKQYSSADLDELVVAPGTVAYDSTIGQLRVWDGSTWSQNTSGFSGDYNDLINKPTIPSLVGYATETYVDTAITNLVNSAPATLNTLNELSTALGNDANFATTVSNQIGLKANSADLATVATSGSYTDLTNIPYLPQRKTLPPTSSIGSVGDKAGDWAIDESYLYYCHTDYSAELTTISIIVDNQTSSSGLRKETGVTEQEFQSWIRMLNPTVGQWKFSFPGSITGGNGQPVVIQNIPVLGVTLNRVNSQLTKVISISFDQNLVNNLPNFNSNYQLLWNKECVLTGRASIWRRVVLNNSGNW